MALAAQALTGLKLLPGYLDKLTDKDVIQLGEWYGPDHPSATALSA